MKSVIERAIGQLRRQFRALCSEVRLSPDKMCTVIMACAVLHISKIRNIALPPAGKCVPLFLFCNVINGIHVN